MLCLSNEPKSKPESFIFNPSMSLSKDRVDLIHLHLQHSTFKETDGEPKHLAFFRKNSHLFTQANKD